MNKKMERENDMKKIMEIKGLCKNYAGNEVLKDVSFEISSGEFAVVMGPSGCGKSTLLYCVSGMDERDSGQLYLFGQELSRLNERETEKLRLRHMGFVFQKANFLKNLSVADNIIFPAFQAGVKSRKEMEEEAESLMEQMGILSVASKDSRKISGGQLQRAAICRAMINQPELLLGDEPTGALNTSATLETMKLFSEINRNGTTLFLVTHDAKVAAWAERIIYLEDGGIREQLELPKYEGRNMDARQKKVQRWLSEMSF